MNKDKMKFLLVGVALSMAATGAMADWTFDKSSNSPAASSYTLNGTGKVAGTNTTATLGVTATAHYLDSNFFNTAPQPVTKVQSSSIGFNGGNGLGVTTTGDSGTPNHSVDNLGQTDLLMFNFTGWVELDLVKLGWVGCTPTSSTNTACKVPNGYDADFNVLYNNKLAKGASYSLNGKTWQDMQNDGWVLVSTVAASTTGSYDVNGNNTATKADDLVSSWWIVSAFNTGFGGSAANAENGNDFFKLAGLVGTVHTTAPPTSKVPEPATLALMGVAMLGMLAARSRDKNRT